MLSLVGEAGPEAIIPLSASRRGRGLDLWMQAGEMLGVTPYADGGITGNTASYHSYLSDNEPLLLDTTPQSSYSQTGTPVSVSLDMPKEMIVKAMIQSGTSGASADEIIALLESRKDELTELVGDNIIDVLADWLEQIFSNSPVRGAP